VSIVRWRPRVKRTRGGGKSGALERAVAPCSQASQSGLWMNPGKGLGAGERLRRSGADLGMKEDHYTAVIRSRIIRRLRVQDPMVGVAHPTLSGFDMMFRGGSFTRL